MRKGWKLVGLLIAGLIVAGCAGGGTEAGTTGKEEQVVPVVVAAEDVVIAEAVIEPVRWSELRVELGGEVIELPVQEGDQVAADALLLRVDTDELALALQDAQQGVVAQRAALELLRRGTREEVIARADKDNADAIAQAEVALRGAELQLERLRADDPEDQVDAAQTQVRQLELQLSQARAQNPEPEVRAAQVGLERTKIALDDAQDEYNKALDRPWEDQGIRDAWSKQLQQRQLDYRLAQAQLDGAQSAQRAHTLGLDVLATQIENAKIGLAQATAAQEAYAVSLDAVAAEVDAARLRLEAQRTWQNPYRDETLGEQIAQAEAGLRQAEIGVQRLEMQLADAELRAPFAGTVVDLRIEAGDQVSPGQAVVVLATLDQLEARTTDLTELDIAQVTIGQAVEVTVDALPDTTFDGVVSEIALQSQDYRGDVVYAVTVELPDTGDAPLRWGMTTVVKIETR